MADTPAVAPVAPAPEPKPVEAPEQWREEFKRTIAQRDEFKTLTKTQSAELERLRAFQQEAAAKDAALKDRLENEKLIAEGKFQELEAKKDTQHKAESEAYRQRVAEKFITAAIKSVAASIPNLTPEAREDLPAILKTKLAFDDTGVDVVPIDEKGLPLKDEKGQPVTYAQFINSFVASKSYMLVDQMPRGLNVKGGSNAPQNLGPMTPAEYEAAFAKDPAAAAAALAAEYSPENMLAQAKARVLPRK